MSRDCTKDGREKITKTTVPMKVKRGRDDQKHRGR